MAKREISIVLSAKNAMAAGIAKASAQLKKFGKGAVRFAKAASKGFLAVGAAILAAAYKAQQFNKQIGQISTLTSMSAKKIKKEIKDISSEFGLAKDELTKGLYDALSAGVPQNNVFDFMRTASKMAIAGAASTADSVDLLTTAVNAFKIPASEAGALSDKLFTTVRLGKTTIAELGQSFSQVAPLAAASGVKIDDVLSAVATLTKQGTPTAQAMTQIRAAIIAMNKTLGDGWSATMTMQQGMQAMSDRAGGSAVEIQKLTGRVEGAMAVMGLTGKNAAMAASDIAEMGKSAGAAASAFAVMEDKNPFDKLMQSAGSMMLTLGDSALELLSPLIIKAADAIKVLTDDIQFLADSGKLAEWAEGAIEAMKKAQPILTAIGAGLGAVKKKIQETAAFWGSITAGGDINTALDMMDEIPAKIEAEKEARKSQLAEERAARKTLREEEKKARAEASKAAAEAAKIQKAIDDAAAKVANERMARIRAIEKEKKDSIKEAADLEKQLADRAKRDREKEEQGRIDGLEKQMAAQKELAAKTIEAFMAEARAAKDLAAQQEKEADRADRLKAKEGRGTKLSKGDREWLDAFNVIQGAKGKAAKGGDLADNIAIAKDNLAQLQKDGKTQVEIRNLMMAEAKKQDKLRKDLSALLMMG